MGAPPMSCWERSARSETSQSQCLSGSDRPLQLVAKARIKIQPSRTCQNIHPPLIEPNAELESSPNGMFRAICYKTPSSCRVSSAPMQYKISE
ncbi:hypothetical protein RRG08_002336 [Elysia crispata]|uniref:Uncharacterized protein n=1 Tax=Elysia crispata TaxID=231223 RepID=A0AAE0ZB27_9GAST|nr:hypothetical protein RRG08_002336 [Elysia crispata]